MLDTGATVGERLGGAFKLILGLLVLCGGSFEVLLKLLDHSFGVRVLGVAVQLEVFVLGHDVRALLLELLELGLVLLLQLE